MKNRYIEAASLLVTEKCNLRCKYCFEEGKVTDKVMSNEVIEASIEFLIDGVKRNGKKEVHVILFGGEPTLAIDALNKILEYGHSRCTEEGLKFSMHMITNATIYNEELEQFLISWKEKLGSFSVQLSVDGIPKVQDMYRVDAQGKGSSNRVEEAISKYLSLRDRLGLSKGSVGIHGCINKETLPHLFESYQYYLDLGFRNAWVMPVHEEEWDDNDREIYREQLNKIKDFIIDKCKEVSNPGPYYSYTTLSNQNECHPSAPCGAGKTFATITADGDLYPCHTFFYTEDSEHLKFGNVLTGEDIEKRKLFLDYSTDNLFGCDKFCSDCDYYSCYRCIAINYKTSGNMFLVPEEYCKMAKVEQEVKLALLEEVSRLFPNEVFSKGNSCQSCNSEEKSPDLEVFRPVLEKIEQSLQSIRDAQNDQQNQISNLNNKIDALFNINTELMYHLFNLLGKEGE